ncbi:exported hypothetical protein [Desulfamplus magnetovallimortis]|uniref:PKD domain-containing protein n=1 Tax=Desulfamplus magnetovallimortis TaxID=1246637 RepID=A0A1W1HC15_9BACT|nr:PKD domain-containing protein [Desulfamplus magnetovallimortis]SLM29983.1 exported hypothetical protein [Desulfamplus magnetovallimortis]
MKLLNKISIIILMIFMLFVRPVTAAVNFYSLYQLLNISYDDFFDPSVLSQYGDVNPITGSYTISCNSAFKVYFPPGAQELVVTLTLDNAVYCEAGYTIEWQSDPAVGTSAVYNGNSSYSFKDGFERITIAATNLSSSQGVWVLFKFQNCPVGCSKAIEVNNGYFNLNLEKYKQWYDCVTEKNMWGPSGDPPSTQVPSCNGTTEPNDPSDETLSITSISPVSGETGEKIQFSAQVNNPDNATILYTWNFGDGSAVEPIYVSSTTHNYTFAGQYLVVLTLSVAGEAPVSSQQWITITDADDEPVAVSINGITPISASVGVPVAFSASLNNPDNVEISSYKWTFGDETEEKQTTVASASYSYNFSGQYLVSLTVSFSDEALTPVSFQQWVTVEGVDEPSVVSINGITPISASVGVPVVFSASLNNPDNVEISSYKWNFGDGSEEEQTTIASASHSYSSSGEYPVSLTVYFSDEASTPISSQQLVTVIDDREPSAVSINGIIPANGFSGEPVVFSASINNPDNVTIDLYEWDFGDGEIFSGDTNSTSHIYTSAGEYTVILNLSVTGQEETQPTFSKKVSIGVTQADLNLAIEQAKESCKNDPLSCGISVFSTCYEDGFTDGFTNGYETAGEEFLNSTESQISISMRPNYDFLIPMIYFSYDNFLYKLTTYFEYISSSKFQDLNEGDLVWKLNLDESEILSE